MPRTKKSLSSALSLAAKCAVTIAFPVVLIACASTTTASPEEQVRQRATQRWSQMMAKNFEKAYAFSTAGFKALVKAEDYRNRFGGSGLWKSAEVVRVDCPEATKCIAKISLTVSPPLSNRDAGGFSTGLDETWLLEAGQWFLYEDVKGY